VVGRATPSEARNRCTERCVYLRRTGEDAGGAFSDYSGKLCKGSRRLIAPAPATMHAGTEGGGGADEPDPDPSHFDEQQCEEGGGGNDEDEEAEAAASASVDVRPSDEAAADGKPSARASASATSAAKGSGSGNGNAVKRKKPKPKHQRSQKPEGYPSRNRYVNRVLLRIGRPARLSLCPAYLYALSSRLPSKELVQLLLPR
jgi:hypothetical protein